MTNSNKEGIKNDSFIKTNTNIIYNEYVNRIIASETNAEAYFLELIDEIQMEAMYATIKKGTIVYRARCIDSSNFLRANGIEISNEYKTKGFNEQNSRECPLGIASEGRNNIEGVSYFYAAEDPATACAEIKSHIKQLVSLADFEVQEDLRIVDFSEDCEIKGTLFDKCPLSAATFMTNIMFSFSRPITNRVDYRVSQIIADHMRKRGIAGIVYRSFFTGKKNYTIFHSHPSKLKFLSSRLLIKQATETYWDFNNNEDIIAQDKEAFVTSNNAYIHLKKLRGSLNTKQANNYE